MSCPASAVGCATRTYPASHGRVASPQLSSQQQPSHDVCAEYSGTFASSCEEACESVSCSVESPSELSDGSGVDSSVGGFCDSEFRTELDCEEQRSKVDCSILLRVTPTQQGY